jgi:hypothetical protein
MRAEAPINVRVRAHLHSARASAFALSHQKHLHTLTKHSVEWRMRIGLQQPRFQLNAPCSTGHSQLRHTDR